MVTTRREEDKLSDPVDAIKQDLTDAKTDLTQVDEVTDDQIDDLRVDVNSASTQSSTQNTSDDQSVSTTDPTMAQDSQDDQKPPKTSDDQNTKE